MLGYFYKELFMRFGYTLASGLTLAALVAGLGACSSQHKAAATQSAAKESKLPQSDAGIFSNQYEEKQSGAQLWAENCERCHNLRSPSQFNAAQWDIIVHHMRVIGGLTAVEARKIRVFLESASGQ